MNNYEETNVIDFTLSYNYEKIHLKTFSEKNIIELARENLYYMNIYKEILKHDYILYMHKDFTSFFIKRKRINTLWKRKDLVKCNDIFYTIDEVPENRFVENQTFKLLVLFSPMPPNDKYNSPSVSERYFVKIFPNMQKYVIKNVVVMRIMDLNLSHGSHYINSTVYPTMEQDIQLAICQVKEKYHITDDNIVLYGVSKGGTGALIHSLLGNYKSLSVDPIISLYQYNKNNDQHFLKGFRQENLVERIKDLSKKNTRKKIEIVCPTVKFNYDIAKQIETPIIRLYDVIDNKITSHPEIAKNVIPEILMFLNSLLLGNQFLVIKI